MTYVLTQRGTGYAQVLSEQTAPVARTEHHASLSLASWGLLSGFLSPPSEGRRHLTLAEQRVLQRALRRSVTVVHKATRRP